MTVEEIKAESHLWKWFHTLDSSGEAKHPSPMAVSYAACCTKRTYLSRPAFDAEVRRLEEAGLISTWQDETIGLKRTHKKWMLDLNEPVLSWDKREKVIYNGVEVEKAVYERYKKAITEPVGT